MKESIKKVLAWYGWILKFNLLVYLSIAVMIIGPLVFIYRTIFLDASLFQLLVGFAASFIAGIFLWYLGWDPYQ